MQKILWQRKLEKDLCSMLREEKVLIVGGSSGIGLSIAKACHDAGATVFILSRNEEKLIEAVKLIGSDVRYIVCDAGDRAQFDLSLNDIGEIDHIVVSAGKPLMKTFEGISDLEAREDMEVNFWLKYNISKASVTYLKDLGSLLFISGAFSQKPSESLFMTSISVAAVEALVKTLALSIGPKRVNAIAPYVIDPSDVTFSSVTESRREFLNTAKNELPGKYIGSGQDIGEAAVFLLKNKYSTGSVLRLDGGYTLT